MTRGNNNDIRSTFRIRKHSSDALKPDPILQSAVKYIEKGIDKQAQQRPPLQKKPKLKTTLNQLTKNLSSPAFLYVHPDDQKEFQKLQPIKKIKLSAKKLPK